MRILFATDFQRRVPPPVVEKAIRQCAASWDHVQTLQDATHMLARREYALTVFDTTLSDFEAADWLFNSPIPFVLVAPIEQIGVIGQFWSGSARAIIPQNTLAHHRGVAAAIWLRYCELSELSSQRGVETLTECETLLDELGYFYSHELAEKDQAYQDNYSQFDRDYPDNIKLIDLKLSGRPPRGQNPDLQ